VYGFDIYTGKQAEEKYEFGLEGDVVLGLIEKKIVYHQMLATMSISTIT
jgi:hypothetical protein